MFHVRRDLELKFALGILDFHLMLSRCFKSLPSLPWVDRHIQLRLEDISRSHFLLGIGPSVFNVSVHP